MDGWDRYECPLCNWHLDVPRSLDDSWLESLNVPVITPYFASSIEDAVSHAVTVRAMAIEGQLRAHLTEHTASVMTS